MNPLPTRCILFGFQVCSEYNILLHVVCGQHLLFTFLYENTMRVYSPTGAEDYGCVLSPPDNINISVMPLCTM